MTLCPTKIETRVNCRLLNGFGSGQSSPEHLRTFSTTFGKSSGIFGRRWEIFGNPVHHKANISRI